MKIFLVIIFFLISSHSYAVYYPNEYNTALPNRNVFLVSNTSNFFKKIKQDNYQIQFFTDKNLTQEHYSISTKGVFLGGKMVITGDGFNEGSTYYKTLDKNGKTPDGDEYYISLDYLFLSNIDGNQIVIPFDEIIDGDIYRVHFKGKDYYFKPDKRIDFKVVTPQLDLKKDFFVSYGKIIDEAIDKIAVCIDKNRRDCITEALGPRRSLAPSLDDIKINLGDNLNQLRKIFKHREKLAFSFRKSRSNNGKYEQIYYTVCYYRSKNSDSFNDSNYDELRDFYKGETYGACTDINQVNEKIDYLNFRILQEPSLSDC